LLTNLRNQMKIIMGYDKAKKAESAIRKKLQEKKKAVNQVKEQYNQLESTWLNNQAVVLASHLHDGESCPVCGSVEHPQKATQETDEISREKLASYKKAVEKEEAEYQDMVKVHSGEVTRITDREHDLKELNITTTDIDTTSAELSEQGEIGRASCREREEIKGGAGAHKEEKHR